MNIFSIFKKSKDASGSTIDAMSQNLKDEDKTISSLEQVDESKQSNVISIAYGTGKPIDVIYAFIEKDYETEGYQDALVNNDAEYCKAKENIILTQLQQLFNRVLLRYKDDIRSIDVQIENAKSLFALTSASKLEAIKKTCEEHISEIETMMEKTKAKAPEMMTMIESYRRGFSKGCAAQTENFLNQNC